LRKSYKGAQKVAHLFLQKKEIRFFYECNIYPKMCCYTR
jgi:hypothetical protein